MSRSAPKRPGVRMSQALREKYPQDMTIVLQHQFWDLGVTEHSFEVGLSFSGVPERLLVPFDALSGFFDPSVQFGLKFDLNETAEGAAEAPAPAGAKSGPRGAASEPTEMKPKAVAPGTGLAAIGSSVPKVIPALPAAQNGKADEKEPRPAAKAAKKEGESTEASAEVVSLDAFRKKS